MNSALHLRSQALTRSRRSNGGHSTRAIIQEEAARPKGAGIFSAPFGTQTKLMKPMSEPVLQFQHRRLGHFINPASVITAAVEQSAVTETPHGRFSRP